MVYAVAIDTAFFVPIGGTKPTGLVISLVSTEQSQHDDSPLKTRRRLGVTVNLRNT
jgi:hypothetical protein